MFYFLSTLERTDSAAVYPAVTYVFEFIFIEALSRRILKELLYTKNSKTCSFKEQYVIDTLKQTTFKSKKHISSI